MMEYYAKRAAEYEHIYAKPERRADLLFMEQFLSGAFPGDRLLEVACGTGYWTQFIARSAMSIVATDCNQSVIEIARQKDFGPCHIEFAVADAFRLDGLTGGYTAGFHGFWWSHVPAARRGTFLSNFHARLRGGANVVMIDNTYVAGSSTPISRQDHDGNTYQTRKLEDGQEYEILKNFPSDSDLYESLSPYATHLRVRRLKYFWIAQYRTRELSNSANPMGGNCAAVLSKNSIAKIHAASR